MWLLWVSCRQESRIARVPSLVRMLLCAHHWIPLYAMCVAAQVTIPSMNYGQIATPPDYFMTSGGQYANLCAWYLLRTLKLLSSFRATIQSSKQVKSKISSDLFVGQMELSWGVFFQSEIQLTENFTNRTITKDILDMKYSIMEDPKEGKLRGSSIHQINETTRARDAGRLLQRRGKENLEKGVYWDMYTHPLLDARIRHFVPLG